MLSREPVLAAYGGGVDSTAMLVEMVSLGEPIDMVLFADTGSEKPETYAYVRMFQGWLQSKGIPSATVRYVPRDFKNHPPYASLEENCLTNGTLPSKAFGFGSCSMKWKVQPQEKFAKEWQPAIDAWAKGHLVVKLIGYDCSPADDRRYQDRAGYGDSDRYRYRYPLREWGWKREDCVRRIEAEGLPVPPKSACFFCPVTKPHELHQMGPDLLRRIVLMEARAAPRLTTVEGLWRTAVKGTRGATPRPGSMTQYIREQGLLPPEEIDHIASNVPTALVRAAAESAKLPVAMRDPLATWLGRNGFPKPTAAK